MIKKIIIIIILVLVVWYAFDKFTIRPSPDHESLDFIKLPEGFKIEVFADNLGNSELSTPGPNSGPRMMDFKSDSVFVTIPKKGEIIVLEDKNKDSNVESKKVFINNLNNPHGISFYDDWVYIAEEDKIIRVKNENNAANLQTVEKIIDLPSGSHWTRTIKIINDQLYISIGSSCNVCVEDDKRRATIQKCGLNGDNCQTFASGLRNSVGFIYYQDKIYASENGRDGLGEDFPPDEINIIQENKNYGWPHCYGKKIKDNDFNSENLCFDTEESFIDLQAHSAPLGLAVYTGNIFPTEYYEKMFVAYHGSWNRDEPTGYKIVMIDLNTKEVEDFATGWLGKLTVKGRPVDIINFRGGLLVSDDNMGKIYRIYYEK